MLSFNFWQEVIFFFVLFTSTMLLVNPVKDYVSVHLM